MGFDGTATPAPATPNTLEHRMGRDGNMYWFCDSCDFVKKRWSRAKRHRGRCQALRARLLAETPHEPPPPAVTPAQSGRRKLARAVRRGVRERDPWEGEEMGALPAERVIKHQYDPVLRKWQQDPALVKCQGEPFAEGAMRECYRLKKLSQQPHRALGIDWAQASNYVAKRYKKAVGREVYFDDVKMQMDSHSWGNAFNRQGVVKQVDFIQAYLVEFVDREDSPLFCVERFIGGAYRKYNSNSGYVLEERDEVRHTPQTFSHFTFHHSGGRAMVVDVQGVGDLYTDPQIHTAEGSEYGDGNLGVRGMALFFSSHLCSALCQRLGLPRFQLCKSEELRLKRQHDMMQFMYAGTQMAPTSVREQRAAHSRQLQLQQQMARAQMGEAALSSLVAGGALPVASEGDSASVGSAREASPPVRGGEDAGSASGGRSGDDAALSNSGTPGPSPSIRSLPPTAASGSVDTPREPCTPYDAEAEGRDPAEVLARVHSALAEYHFEGRVSDPPDIAAWRHHHTLAARASHRYSAVRLAVAIEVGTVGDYPLPGAEGPDPAGALPWYSRAAELGSTTALIKVGIALYQRAAAGSEDWAEATALLTRALEAEEEEDESAVLVPTTSAHERHHVCDALAMMAHGGGLGVSVDHEAAAGWWDQAAEAAMAAMRMGAANGYMARAEEARALVDA